MFRPSNVFIFSILFFLLIGSTRTFAQSNGAIEGTVTDEKNEPVIGALISVYWGSIKKGATVTDIDGNYIVKPLPAGGGYETVASYNGYKNVRITEIALSHDGVAKVNINFNPNTLEEHVIVYKKPLISNGEKGCRLYNGIELQKAPTRDLTKLIATQPGMANTGRPWPSEPGSVRGHNVVPMSETDKKEQTSTGMASSTYQPLHNCGDPSRNGSITMLDGMVVKQPKLPACVNEEKKKKRFFSFLKRKKKSYEQ